MAGLFEQLSGAAAARAEGRSAQRIAGFNATVAEQEATAQREKAQFAQKRQAKKAVAAKSALTAQIGAAGGIGSPVAADLAAEQASELELENLLIGFEGEAAARRAETQAKLDKMSGQFARLRGNNAASAANVGFGLDLAGLAIGGGLLKGKSKLPAHGTFRAATGMNQTQFGRKFLEGF